MLDKIFLNGEFYSKNTNGPIHSIGIKDGFIAEIGNDENKISSQAGQVIDLKGKAVYPGFIDAHLHLLMYCDKKFNEVDLSHVESLEELVSVVKNFISEKEIGPGDWVVGSGWNHEKFKDKKLPDRYLLDRISSENPIFLNRACYHICVVNSMALDLTGVNNQIGEVDGGSIDRDCEGKLTGVFRENGVSIIADRMPKLNNKSLIKEMIVKGCYDLAMVGITTVHSDDFAHVEDKVVLWEAYKELAEENLLPINVVLQLRVSDNSDIDCYKKLGLGSWEKYNNLTIGPIKIIADGSLGSRTAALNEAYSDDVFNKGILLIDEGKLDGLIKETVRNGFDICVHGIGDRTMDLILDSYDSYMDEFISRGFRPSIIHCQIGSEEILRRFKRLDIIANIQPVFLNTDWHMAEKRVGKERMEYSYCWKKYMKKGIKCVGSSDAPIESFNPLYGIYCGVSRKDLMGNPLNGWIIEEGLSLDQGISLYTENGAYASKEESQKGRLDLGMRADFVVLSEDLGKCGLDRIKDILVEKTFVMGEEVQYSPLVL